MAEEDGRVKLQVRDERRDVAEVGFTGVAARARRVVRVPVPALVQRDDAPRGRARPRVGLSMVTPSIQCDGRAIRTGPSSPASR